MLTPFHFLFSGSLSTIHTSKYKPFAQFNLPEPENIDIYEVV